jgi:orotidine-5'-phosphate decarboxylase
MFEGLGADAATVAPYMGRDSVEPFTAFDNRWTVLLALTSNQGANDYEFHGMPPLFHQVLETSQSYANADRLMYVVGATRPEQLGEARKKVPQAFLLVPGVGAQGGSVEEVARFGLNGQCGLLVNSSRGILYAAGPDASIDAAKQASAAEAASLAGDMRRCLEAKGLV